MNYVGLYVLNYTGAFTFDAPESIDWNLIYKINQTLVEF